MCRLHDGGAWAWAMAHAADCMQVLDNRHALRMHCGHCSRCHARGCMSSDTPYKGVIADRQSAVPGFALHSHPSSRVHVPLWLALLTDDACMLLLCICCQYML